RLLGAATATPGAPPSYTVQSTDLKGAPADVDLDVSVYDGAKKLADNLTAEKRGHGAYSVTVPPDLPIPPGSEPTLVVSAKNVAGKATEVREQVKMVLPVYLTHLTTDKPMYQPGETVFFRSLTLDRQTLKPAQDDLNFYYTLTYPSGQQVPLGGGGNSLRTSEGKEIAGPDGKPVRGIGAGQVALDPNVPGGEYTLSVREL